MIIGGPVIGYRLPTPWILNPKPCHADAGKPIALQPFLKPDVPPEPTNKLDCAEPTNKLDPAREGPAVAARPPTEPPAEPTNKPDRAEPTNKLEPSARPASRKEKPRERAEKSRYAAHLTQVRACSIWEVLMCRQPFFLS